MRGWRPALRIARREVLRAKGRSLLVLLMVLLPVAGVVCLDTLVRTADTSAYERLPRDLGTAQARVDLAGSRVEQSPDLRHQSVSTDPSSTPLTAQRLRELLPPGAVLQEVRTDWSATVRTADGRARGAALLTSDLRDPRYRGPYPVLRGEAPDTATEVAVTTRLERRGLPVGSEVRLADGTSRRVVGVVGYPADTGTPSAVVGLPGALPLAELGGIPTRWFVHGDRPVTWADVQRLNAQGGLVLSRAVVEDPPPYEGPSGNGDTGFAVVLGLVVVMAVLEVVLLAGPAFAVGARRQRRTLALMAATGAEPKHLRRVVLAQGVVVGGMAAVGGALLGVAAAVALKGPLEARGEGSWGPLEVSPRSVLLVALLGAATAVLAALAPAVVASRQPVLPSLLGRRPPVAPSRRSGLAGLLLVGVGVLVVVDASRLQQGGEVRVAAGAVPVVLGAALLAPAVLRLLGRTAGRLPLALRYVVRDADRQRPRTGPAVAAVTGVVAAAVALGVAAASDDQQQRRESAPRGGPVGTAVVTSPNADDAQAWERLVASARDAVPGTEVDGVAGVRLPELHEVEARCAGTVACLPIGTSHSQALDTSVLVGEQALAAVAAALDPASLREAREALRSGRAAVAGPERGPWVLAVVQHPRQGGEIRTLRRVQVDAVPLRGRDGTYPPALAVVPEAVGRQLGPVGTTALLVGPALTEEQEVDLRDVVRDVDDQSGVYVDRGPAGPEPALLAMVAVVAALVVGGTLASTSLALAEAAPDLAVLHAVGARPRTRRSVAAAYAFVVALVGAVLGTVAGLVPGTAAAHALTRSYGSSGYDVDGWVLVVPWPLLAAALLGLPLVAAAVAAAVQGRRDDWRVRGSA